MRRQRFVAVLVTLLVAAFATGCGDDGGDEVSSPAETTQRPTGEPIRLGLVTDADFFPGGVTAAKAAVKAINASGGVKGRPLELTTCDTESDPNHAAKCARDLVGAGVVAVVGAASYASDQYMPVFEEAGIPVIGNLPVGAIADATSEVAFPLVGGIPTLAAGEAGIAIELGAKKPSLMLVDVPAAAAVFPMLINQRLREDGVELVNNVAVPIDAPDMSSYVAAASKGGTDAILLGVNSTDAVKIVKAARQAGVDVPFISDAFNTGAGLAAGFAGDLEGVYVSSWFTPATVTSNAAIEKFLDEIAAVDEDAEKGDDAINGWASVYVFADAAEKAATIDAAAILAALPTLTDLDLGVMPPLSFDKASTAIPGVSRMFNTSVIYTRVEDGGFVPLTGEFVEIFAPPS